ncbi:hypothetical protein J8273_8952 [Carpediemonas membranifera]|uniref:Calponin-homology (CH) domain-containing protein n=1 Tax=Carpediemonas membranifera TaxID=201153 RepID=A0A8J6APM6_9EUKA|nr:hypothetical protein J8273_8952 [Carpediemonas membranifera]|eukprot:KAG9389653.1 hypothetical protein J8273_8952 [Carpediemonas membranifera]
MSSLSEEELQDLYSWVDTIELSRPKRNIARDFSDACMFAELVHQFHPNLVELHNYSPASSFDQKKYNWQTLKKKILGRSKLNLPLSNEEIASLAKAEPGAIEELLWRARPAIDSFVFVPKSSRPRERERPSSYMERHKVDKDEESHPPPRRHRTRPSDSPSPSPRVSRGGSAEPYQSGSVSYESDYSPMSPPAGRANEDDYDEFADEFDDRALAEEIDREFSDVTARGGPTVEEYMRMKHELDEKRKHVAILEAKNMKLQELAALRGEQVRTLKEKCGM